MKIILVHPRGFCAGVRMAIDVVDQVLGLFPGETIYVFHEIVHNKHVVGRFTRRGVVFVERLEDIPDPRGKIVVFSAHGISPAIRQRAAQLDLFAIDATCPLVTKVHSEAVRYARQGYQILLVGHRNHQEVIGTTGEAPAAIQVVESPEDIPRLAIADPQRLVYLTQTTLSTDDAGVIIDALKRAFPHIKEPPSSDICYATTNRQHAVRKVAPDCDAVLVVGSKNSSNSVRLTEISQTAGTPAYLLDDVSELDPAWFPTGRETVMITAGASAPEDLVAEICRALVQRYGRDDRAARTGRRGCRVPPPRRAAQGDDRARHDPGAREDHDARGHDRPVRRIAHARDRRGAPGRAVRAMTRQPGPLKDDHVRA